MHDGAVCEDICITISLIDSSAHSIVQPFLTGLILTHGLLVSLPIENALSLCLCSQLLLAPALLIFEITYMACREPASDRIV